MGKGGRGGARKGRAISPGSSRGRSRRVRLAAQSRGQDRSLPHQAQGLVQIRGLMLIPSPSPRKRREGDVSAQFVFTSGQPPLSSGRNASSPGTVAISL